MDQQVKQSDSYSATLALFKGNTRTIIVTAVIIFAFLVLGSYIFGWNWTGFDHNTLFQWLKLLLVPIVVAAAPAWFNSHPSIQARWARIFIASMLLLVVLLIASVTFNWNWTGFRSATLWDWLNLLLLPLALTTLMVWVSIRPTWQPHWTALAAVLLLVFAITIFGGYAFDWKWTGYHGNTLWDWLNLLVLPFALPAIILWYGAHQDKPAAAGASAGASQGMPVTPAPANPGTAYYGTRTAPQAPLPPAYSTPAHSAPAGNDRQGVAGDSDDDETVRLSEIAYLLEGREEAE